MTYPCITGELCTLALTNTACRVKYLEMIKTLNTRTASSVLRPIRLYYLRQRSDRSITRYDFTHSVSPSSQVEVVRINVLLSSKRSLIRAALQGVGPPRHRGPAAAAPLQHVALQSRRVPVPLERAVGFAPHLSEIQSRLMRMRECVEVR